MKTIAEVNREIISLHKELVEASKIDTKKAKNFCKKLNKQIKWIMFVKSYLETDPRPEFVKKELETVVFRIGKIDEGYLYWAVGRQLTKYRDPKKAYTNEMGLPVLKEQLRTLKYILR